MLLRLSRCMSQLGFHLFFGQIEGGFPERRQGVAEHLPSGMFNASPFGESLELIERLVVWTTPSPRSVIRGIREYPGTRLLLFPFFEDDEKFVGQSDWSFTAFCLQVVLDLEVERSNPLLTIDLVPFEVKDFLDPSTCVRLEVHQCS